MDIQVPRDPFLRALQLVQNIVEPRQTLPILANVLIEAQTDGLRVAATDLEVGARVTVPATVVRPGGVTLAARKLVELVRERWAAEERLDYLICDEACFYTVEQVEQMADLVDVYDVDVFAFGLATDFRSELFPASKRLFELADGVARLQVEVLCWCGRVGQLNARVVGGVVAREGEQVVIGDTGTEGTAAAEEVRYQVLCRRHYRAGDLGPKA